MRIVARSFARDCCGCDDVRSQGDALWDSATEFLVITDGAAGSYVWEKKGSYLHQPACKAEPLIDTTGCTPILAAADRGVAGGEEPGQRGVFPGLLLLAVDRVQVGQAVDHGGDGETSFQPGQPGGDVGAVDEVGLVGDRVGVLHVPLLCGLLCDVDIWGRRAPPKKSAAPDTKPDGYRRTRVSSLRWALALTSSAVPSNIAVARAARLSPAQRPARADPGAPVGELRDHPLGA